MARIRWIDVYKRQALHIAKALKAKKLVFMTDVPGILKDVEDPNSFISVLEPCLLYTSRCV